MKKNKENMKILYTITFWFTVTFFNITIATAQRPINVKGRVMQIPVKMENGQKVIGEKQPFEYVHIYGIPTKLDAERVAREFNEVYYHDRKDIWEYLIGPEYNRLAQEAISAVDGTYTVREVPENGYLVFLPYEGEAKILPINGLLEVDELVYDFTKDDSGIHLSEVDVIAEDLGPKIDGELNGDIYTMSTEIPFLVNLLKKNVRILIQPYFMDCNPETLKEEESDTSFLSPIVYYCNENELTSERRQNFNLALDSLISIAVDSMQINKGKLKIERQFRFPDANRFYKAYAELYYEDYNGILETGKELIKHCEAKEPMRFLDFDFGAMFLNPADPEFKVQPIESFQDAVGDINLTFLNGKAELDPENPNNELEIARLQDEMLAIENTGNHVLRTLTIIGKASPEGNYESNKALAGRRINFALNKITSAFSQYTRNRLKITQSPIVAGWDEVADSMAVDSLYTEAEEIRSIITTHEGNLVQQYAKIRTLPYYNSVIKEKYLPKLRAVKYQYTYQTMRSLTDSEILAKYHASKDSTDKKVFFDRYEYWRLVNKVEDSTELSKIYKGYYELTKKNQRKPDELAACNHAAFCIREGIADSTILAPYIKKNRGVNWSLTNMAGEKEIYNREAIIANQLAMYVLCKDYRNAGIMSSILPESQNNLLLRAFVKCLSGLYRKPQYSGPVAETSPNNKVVINIALGNFSLAQVVAQEELEDTNPRKFYFLAQIGMKTNDDTKNIVDNLLRCFKLDENFVAIADADATFVDNKGQKPKFVQAFDKYMEFKNKSTQKETSDNQDEL